MIRVSLDGICFTQPARERRTEAVLFVGLNSLGRDQTC